MHFDWLALAAFAGAVAVIFWVRQLHPDWQERLLYTLQAVAMIAILMFTFTGRAFFSSDQPETTTRNIEDNIKTWSKPLNFTVTKMPDDPTRLF